MRSMCKRFLSQRRKGQENIMSISRVTSRRRFKKNSNDKGSPSSLKEEQIKIAVLNRYEEYL